MAGPAAIEASAFDFQAHFCHAAPVETHDSGPTRANAPEDQTPFPIRAGAKEKHHDPGNSEIPSGIAFYRQFPPVTVRRPDAVDRYGPAVRTRTIRGIGLRRAGAVDSVHLPQPQAGRVLQTTRILRRRLLRRSRGHRLLASDNLITWLEKWSGEMSSLALAAFAFGSLFVRSPFTLPYAKETTPKEYWDSPLFLHVNWIVTLVWALSFTVAAAAGLYGDVVTRSARQLLDRMDHPDRGHAVRLLLHRVVPGRGERSSAESAWRAARGRASAHQTVRLPSAIRDDRRDRDSRHQQRSRLVRHHTHRGRWPRQRRPTTRRRTEANRFRRARAKHLRSDRLPLAVRDLCHRRQNA